MQIPALLGKNKPNNRPIDRPTDGYEGLLSIRNNLNATIAWFNIDLSCATWIVISHWEHGIPSSHFSAVVHGKVLF